jgi:hypothetical protein
MRSRVAAEVARNRRERLAAMTADERVALTIRMGASGLASYMSAYGVDRATAIAQIKATRRLGRKPSASAEGA